MFQSLRANSQFYILHKDGVPLVEVGTVTSVSAPTPKFPNPMPAFGQPQEMTVDVNARVKDNNVTFQKLPATQDVADFGANGLIVLATTKEAINAELSALKQRSYDIVNSRDYHLSIIEGCDKAYKALNPEYAEKQQQAEEITLLKSQMTQMAQSINELMEMNRNLIGQMNSNLTEHSKKTGTSKKE